MIIVNATTSPATDIMESFALDPIMEYANVENVFAIQNGIVQVLFIFMYMDIFLRFAACNVII